MDRIRSLRPGVRAAVAVAFTAGLCVLGLGTAVAGTAERSTLPGTADVTVSPAPSSEDYCAIDPNWSLCQQATPLATPRADEHQDCHCDRTSKRPAREETIPEPSTAMPKAPATAAPKVRGTAAPYSS